MQVIYTLLKLFLRQRAGIEEALAKVAAGMCQQVVLLFGFYLFSAHLQAQSVGHDDNRITQRQIIGLLLQIMNKTAVDL